MEAVNQVTRQAAAAQLGFTPLRSAKVQQSEENCVQCTKPKGRGFVNKTFLVSVFNVVPGKWLVPCTDLRLASGKVMLSPSFFCESE